MNSFVKYDMALLDFIYSQTKSDFLDKIIPVITKLGNNGYIWIAIALFMLCIAKYRYYGGVLAMSLVINVIICNVLLKPLVGRIRPCDINQAIVLLIPRPIDFSFPSGHTTAAFTAATILFFMNKKLGIVVYAFSTLLAFSRLYLYVHYPSDIVCGAILGVLFGLTGIYLANYLKKIMSKSESAN